MTSFADPPLTPKAVETRARLLELAAELFVEQGYSAVSLRDIADAANLTKGAIYGHFRSKGQLLIEVIRTRLVASDAHFKPEEASSTSAFSAFIHPANRDLRLLQLDAAAAARHDPDVAAGVAELHESRGAWIHELLPYSPEAETIAFVINTLAAGVGAQEAHGREAPNHEAWEKVVSAMFRAAFGQTESDPRK